ncbi:MAG: type IV pili twitching motility protein PilT [Thiotrichales bacterium 32-46-8]|nr:PilT/PilU family type 4a pilus ATPase [Gammaproteobacteria bacterium]OYX07355.1 MAG: type IV pili twitching motility protein PilT [Thiotrichales bacterium 32-46-8]OYZ03781.1 MAG: type IV pili twitching motility protein PilT [Thiotrichales bacterium 16-46-22]OZA16692.1 MAG: type IV pili twitching motility protein PilT [Thiotrichales bacterium 17-46-47]HQT01836.1 PilT/PilU family type 4a pilus ATPase [Thiotrichales bacterium]
MTESEGARAQLHQLLQAMVESKASDMFVVAGAPVSFKIDGLMHPVTQQHMMPVMTRQLAETLLNESQLVEFNRSHEFNLAYSIPALGRFRVNLFIQRNSVGIVIRTINTTIPAIDSLALPDIVKQLVLEKRGLILVVGGTGSGKSTSLAGMIGYRNQHTQGHIITIEDPIEFVHAHGKSIITQREVGTDTESFEVALKNTLRQAPDVILIGEVRSRETMEHAITFAETGHLCLSTLHANNANQALDRIINFFPEERKAQLLMDLSLNLRAIISQRLVPKQSGKGRVAAIEVLINSPRMSDLIFSGQVHEMKSVMMENRDMGMQTFDQSLFDLYESQQISYADALRFADAVNDLRLRIKLSSQRFAQEQPDTSAQDGINRFELKPTQS